MQMSLSRFRDDCQVRAWTATGFVKARYILEVKFRNRKGNKKKRQSVKRYFVSFGREDARRAGEGAEGREGCRSRGWA